VASPDERAGRIRGNLNSRAANLASNNNERTDRIRGNLTARAQRQTKGLIEGLQALAVPERQPPRLTRVEPRGSIPAARGYAEVNQQPGKGGTGSGLASPLTEGDTADPASPADPVLQRTYHDATQMVSSDGLFVWEIEPIKTIRLRDANGDPAEFRFADPYFVADPAP